MIAGIGTDIVAIERMRSAWQRHGEKLTSRILTPNELSVFNSFRDNEVAFLARRFAAKEAAAKALGTGFRDGVGLRSLEVCHDGHGKPELRLLDGAARRGEQLRISATYLSLSDEHDYAVAFVIMVAEV